MSKLDIQLYRLLIEDPRMSYRELASRLGTSPASIHKRLQALTAAGIVHGVVLISTRYVNGTIVTVFGKMEGDRPIEEIVDKLRKDECFMGAFLCTSNQLCVSGFLRRPVDMDHFQEFVKVTCQMKDAVLSIDSLNELDKLKPPPEISPKVRLGPLDLRIIASLHLNARKSYDDVGRELGLSAKTVRKHLDRMIEDGSIELWIVLDPSVNPDFFTMLQVRTREGADRTALGVDLMHRFPNNVAFFRTYCNLPGEIIVGTLNSSTFDLYDLVEKLVADDRIKNVVPHIVLRWWWAETWRDQMIPGREQRSIWPPIKGSLKPTKPQ